MQLPPPLPETVLRRVLAVARGDGWSLVVVAGLGALYTAWQGNGPETFVALLVTGSGLAELHGRHRLLQGRAGGINWLVGAQLALLAVIGGYAGWRWQQFDAEALWSKLPAMVQARIDQEIIAAGGWPKLDRPPLLLLTHRLTCVVLVLVTLCYQGGLALWYARSRRAVAEALLVTHHPEFQRAQTSSHQKAQETTKRSP